MTPIAAPTFGPYEESFDGDDPKMEKKFLLVPKSDMETINNNFLADAKAIFELRERIKELEQALDHTRPPMYWWCDADPETGGDTPLEALKFLAEGFDAGKIEWEPQLLHATFSGPSKWAVLVPGGFGDEAIAHTFNTEQEAITFRDVTRKARAS